MEVFGWEQSIIDWARTLPHDGPWFYFFNFWSDYNESRWPFLVFIAVLGFYLGWRKLITPAVLTILSVAAGDLVSRRVVKFFIERPRPNFIHEACTLSKCWGFVSSHSTNVTAAAVVLCMYDRRNMYWTLPTVFLVAISRVYLIDHYPLDVLGGVILGALIGLLVWHLFSFYRDSRNPQNIFIKGDL